jgi:predicted transcriptional regulator
MTKRTMLSDAILSSDILSTGQKKVLNIICSSDYPVSVKGILDIMGSSKQAVHISIKSLLERGFITKHKDRVFVYKPNKARIAELETRYIQKLSLK